MITDEQAREHKRKEKQYLRDKYPDYDPRRHDVFLYRDRAEREKKALHTYMINRGIVNYD